MTRHDPLKTKGQRAYLSGAAAEESVKRHYEARGLQVAAMRWRGEGGELDLVLRDGAAVVFVEVKKSASFARAAASLSRRQVERLIVSAQSFLGSEPRGLLTEARFDVALVDATGALEIHENALSA
jgi:putative endonuclease